MNIIKILYLSLIGSLAAIMMGSLCANDNLTTGKLTRVKIDGYIFELYPPDTQAQTQIIHALYKILNHDDNGTDKDEYYNQYREAIELVGHHTILLWKNALTARIQTEDGTNVNLFFHPFGPWVIGRFKRLNYLLDIAIKEGRGNMSYQEFLNTLESFYTTDNDHRNEKLDEMIKERDHIRSLA